VPNGGRVAKDINHCSRKCCYFRECKGFRNRDSRCPTWTLDCPIRFEDAEQTSTELATQEFVSGFVAQLNT